MNRLRVPLIRQSLLESGPPADQTQSSIPSKPLVGYSVLDVGCGGGVLSEPLARLGAQVTGIDIGEKSIAAAKFHAELDDEVRDNVQYECATVEELLLRDGLKFDCVVASEVVEHIPLADQRTFILNCCKLAKHSIVVTTVNQTSAAYWLGIVAAEKVFRIVPWGTHEFSMLVPPESLQDMLKEGGATMRRLHGMYLNPVTMEWNWTNYTLINYAIQASVFPAEV
jgi:polyprenyldihydroxybenzoate methyltransferase/3-demethylubiquinol 3-O-methyltransferase